MPCVTTLNVGFITQELLPNVFSHLSPCLHRSSACASVSVYISTSPDLRIFDVVICALFTKALSDLDSVLFSFSWMTLCGSLRLQRASVSAFLLNLIMTHLCLGAASAGVMLAERRDCTDGGGGAAAAIFAQLWTADCGLLLCVAGGVAVSWLYLMCSTVFLMASVWHSRRVIVSSSFLPEGCFRAVSMNFSTELRKGLYI